MLVGVLAGDSSCLPQVVCCFTTYLGLSLPFIELEIYPLTCFSSGGPGQAQHAPTIRTCGGAAELAAEVFVC